MLLDAAPDNFLLRHAGVTDFSLSGQRSRAVRMIIPVSRLPTQQFAELTGKGIIWQTGKLNDMRGAVYQTRPFPPPARHVMAGPHEWSHRINNGNRGG